MINLDYINQYENSEGLYLSAREAAAELAISPATLYAYVSRGLVRSEPTPDSRKNRYRAEDVRALKERRVPSPEPRGLRSFDADLPVMDTEISTITEEGAIYRGVSASISRRTTRWSTRRRFCGTSPASIPLRRTIFPRCPMRCA